MLAPWVLTRLDVTVRLTFAAVAACTPMDPYCCCHRMDLHVTPWPVAALMPPSPPDSHSSLLGLFLNSKLLVQCVFLPLYFYLNCPSVIACLFFRLHFPPAFFEIPSSTTDAVSPFLHFFLHPSSQLTFLILVREGPFPLPSKPTLCHKGAFLMLLCSHECTVTLTNCPSIGCSPPSFLGPSQLCCSCFDLLLHTFCSLSQAHFRRQCRFVP